MKRFVVLFITATSCAVLWAQFPYGTTGLLHMPTANMQKDKTFMFGGSFLNKGSIPPMWQYNTYNYYINVTFFPFLEVGYTCTLHKGVPGNYWPEQTWGKFVNQDRQFSVRLRVIKEGFLWKHMPSIVIGCNDIGTNDIFSGNKDGYGFTLASGTGNAAWSRYFIASTKYFLFEGIGEMGVHLSYVYNKRKDYPLNGPAVGINFQLGMPYSIKVLNGLNLMAEYDARTVNMGLSYSLWKDYINVIGELNDFKYLSAGIYFKVHLK